MYSQKVMEIFKNPRNMGRINNADGVGEVGNAMCGDIMKIYIKVKKNKGKEIIRDIKVETFGCVAALVTSSVLTEKAKGKTLQQAEKITPKDIVRGLGKIPPEKFHCSVLSTKALTAAIEDYKKKSS